MRAHALALLTAIIWMFSNQLHAAEADTNLPYLWRAELDGPTRECRVPPRFLFVMADAIISGRIKFGGKNYFPKGRIENSRAADVMLVRFHDDPRPLVKLTAIADGSWNGEWVSSRPGCTGRVLIVERP
jgi:hypothetical protein